MVMGAFLRMGISTRTTFRMMALVVCLFFSASPVFAATTPWIGDAHAAARMMTAVRATGSTGEIDAALQIRLAPGWHAYWRSPGDAGFPPSIDWSGSQNLQSAQIYWPAPKRFLLDGLITQGYEKNVVLPIAVTMRQPGEPILLHALVHYAACKNICVPYTAAFTLRLPPGLATPGAGAALIAQAWTLIPGSLADAGLSLASVIVSPASGQGAELSVSLRSQQAIASPDMFVEGVTGPTPGRPKIQLGAAGHRAVLSVFLAGKPGALAGRPLTFTIEAKGQAATFEAAPAPGVMPRIGGSVFDPLIILIALLGGLVLNVMPCVLPVLSLKLFGLIGARGQVLRQFRLSLLATAAGVMASFLVLALVLVLLKTAGAAIGWGIQFQQPWFLGAMAVVTSLFAASLWEWVPIGVPGFVGALGAGRGKHVAAFLTGALAGVLAASCTAPFIGTAVGFALARGPMTIIGIFTALGLGMALPYAAVAALPGLVGWLPKPGAWMVRLRVILGFMLLGTAMWLVWVMSAVVSPDAAIIIGVVLAAFVLVLFLRHQGRAVMPRWRPALTCLAVGLGVSAVVLPGLIPRSAPAPAVSAIWQPFDEAQIPGLVASNRVVFVDVTAAWCLICKVNALTVLDRNPVGAALRAADVTAMRGDWTRPSPLITAYLERFDRYGVPLDVVYGPGAPQGIVLPSLLTPGVVMNALRRAGA